MSVYEKKRKLHDDTDGVAGWDYLCGSEPNKPDDDVDIVSPSPRVWGEDIRSPNKPPGIVPVD